MTVFSLLCYFSRAEKLRLQEICLLISVLTHFDIKTKSLNKKWTVQIVMASRVRECAFFLEAQNTRFYWYNKIFLSPHILNLIQLYSYFVHFCSLIANPKVPER